MEIYKLKDRKGAMRERKILHWDGARTLFSDLPDTSSHFRQEDMLEGSL